MPRPTGIARPRRPDRPAAEPSPAPRATVTDLIGLWWAVRKIKRNPNPEMKRDQILGIVRHVLTFAGGLAVAKGIVDQGMMLELVGGAVTVIGGIWSILDKTSE